MERKLLVELAMTSYFRLWRPLALGLFISTIQILYWDILPPEGEWSTVYPIPSMQRYPAGLPCLQKALCSSHRATFVLAVMLPDSTRLPTDLSPSFHHPVKVTMYTDNMTVTSSP